MIRLLLADDHKLVREGLKQIVAGGHDLTVEAEAATGDQALDLVKQQDFDLVLLDMSMPGLSGINLIKRLKLERPRLRILVLSMHGEQQYAARALKAGASGYLTKDSASEQLLGAIRKVAAGGVHIPDAVAASLIGERSQANTPAHTQLSDREFEVFRMLAEGKGPGEIADHLHLSIKTVSTHKARIFEKMSFKSTTDLVRYALDQGMLDKAP